jgi:hypothetical protein
MSNFLSITTSDYLSVVDGKLGDLFLSGRRQFRIPYNQRPWTWKERDLLAIWEDLNQTVDGFFNPTGSPLHWVARQIPSKYPHFIGAFVFLESEDDGLEVVDGQQRLTAISMLVAALRDVAREVSNTALDPNVRVTCNGICSSATNWLVSDHLSGRSRLLADAQHHPLFEALVISPDDSKTRAALLAALKPEEKELKEHLLLQKGFKFFHDSVLNKVSTYEEKERCSYLGAVFQSLQSAFFAAWVIIKKEPYAFQVFGCLNARGVPLSEADKLKNELFSSSDKANHQDIVENWRSLQENAPRNDVSSFLRRRFIALLSGECPQNRLYEFVKKHELSIAKAAIPGLVDDWREDAKLLHQIVAAGFPGITPRTKELLKNLEILGISLSEIFLLSAGKTFLRLSKFKDFEKAVELCTHYCFRALTIGKEDTAVLEGNLGVAARLLFKEKALISARNYLDKENSDATFESKFQNHTESRVRVQFYILYQLERHLSGASGLVPAPHSPAQHIEHVMPQKPAKSPKRLSEWAWARENPGLHSTHLNRIGNLCILEADINIHVSNYEFLAKQTGTYPLGSGKVKGHPRKSYKDSKLQLAIDLSSTAKWKDWGFAEIEQRQKELAKIALLVWKL